MVYSRETLLENSALPNLLFFAYWFTDFFQGQKEPWTIITSISSMQRPGISACLVWSSVTSLATAYLQPWGFSGSGLWCSVHSPGTALELCRSAAVLPELGYCPVLKGVIPAAFNLSTILNHRLYLLLYLAGSKSSPSQLFLSVYCVISSPADLLPKAGEVEALPCLTRRNSFAASE